MSLLKFILIGFLLLASSLFAHAQLTDPSFITPTLTHSFSNQELVRQTKALPPGISKARQLLALAKIYMNEGRGKNLDTSLTFIQDAFDISNAIRDSAGIIEALARRCVILVLKRESASAGKLLPAK